GNDPVGKAPDLVYGPLHPSSPSPFLDPARAPPSGQRKRSSRGKIADGKFFSARGGRLPPSGVPACPGPPANPRVIPVRRRRRDRPRALPLTPFHRGRYHEDAFRAAARWGCALLRGGAVRGGYPTRSGGD